MKIIAQQTIVSQNTSAEILRRLQLVKITARTSLGIVWLFEGLVPKILFVSAHPEQIELVRRSGLFWKTPEITLAILGIAQAILALILFIGWFERAAVAMATAGMVVLIGLVACNHPILLTDPFGALIKDACLIACAATVWWLAPLTSRNA